MFKIVLSFIVVIEFYILFEVLFYDIMCMVYLLLKLFMFDIIGVCFLVVKVYIKYCKLVCDERSGYFFKEVLIVIVVYNYFCGDIE